MGGLECQKRCFSLGKEGFLNFSRSRNLVIFGPQNDLQNHQKIRHFGDLEPNFRILVDFWARRLTPIFDGVFDVAKIGKNAEKGGFKIGFASVFR